MRQQSVMAALALLLNAMVWGLSWWPLRQLEAAGLHPLWATVCIFSLATLVLLLIHPMSWRHFNKHSQLWWLMLTSGLTNVGFNWAVTTGDVVRVVLLFYLMPTWSLLLAWWLLDERPTHEALMRLTLTLLGVVLVLKTPESNWPLPQNLSDILALVAGFCFALTNIWLLRLQDTAESARMLAMFGGGAVMATVCAGLAVALGLIPPFLSVTPNNDYASALTMLWAWGPYVFGLSASFLISNFTLQFGAARLSAHTTAMLMTSEVVFSSASSAWLGASLLTWRISLGGCMIVLAALLATHSHKPQKSAL